jgi:hypothetical protein
VDGFPALFEIPQLDLLQSQFPTFNADWMEFLNFEPDLSLFPPSPSLASSLASTPPLVDDAILPPASPSSLPENHPPSPELLRDILPRLLGEKYDQFPMVREPAIREQEFLLPPGDVVVIPSISALLSVH